MQSMTRSVSLNLSALNQRIKKENPGHSEDQIEAFDGETAALKQFCFHVRSYGTCGDFTPYVPSPTSQNHKFKKCLSHVVAEHETLAGIALKYDISVEDIRRINSFLWTSNSVWVGQIIKVPVIDKIGIYSENSSERKNSSNESSGEKTDDITNQKSAKNAKSKRRLSASATNLKMGPSPTEFWTKMDSSIEESKKVQGQLKKNSPPHSNLQESDKDMESSKSQDLKC